MRIRSLWACALACAATFLLLAPRTGLGQDAVKHSPKSGAAHNKAAEEEVIKLTQEWAAASRRSDVATLEKFFTDDLEYIHTTSKTSYKKDFLDEVRGGDRRWDNYDLSEVRARVFGDSAIATGNLHIKVIVNNRPPNELHAVISVFWVKQPEWRMAWIHMTRIPDAPAGGAAGR